MAEETTPLIRKRQGSGPTPAPRPAAAQPPDDSKTKPLPARSFLQSGHQTGKYWGFTLGSVPQHWYIGLAVATALGFLTRFYRLSNPDEVVFDEVHFGKFASYYLRGTYYFDVHPPLGKLLFALQGYLLGYDGHYDFANIGENYISNNVPYIGLRVLPAFFGMLIVPMAWWMCYDLGFSFWGAVATTAMVLFDNGLVTQSRLILLDASLIFFMVGSAFAWIRFYKQRFQPFSLSWWFWLLATGFMMAGAAGVKMVGLLVVAAVGIATVLDLWELLDYRRGLSLPTFAKHFAARAAALIAVPTMLYLSFFYAHFQVLSKSGPGDTFMSPAFQSTLIGNDMAGASQPVVYGGNLTLRHRDTSAYLHSHPDRYPLRYEDQRVSSQGQQVTGYPHKDHNNVWVLERADDNASRPLVHGMDQVHHGDRVRIRHFNTNSYLCTHDVASPLMPTHMEMTTLAAADAEKRRGETVWEVQLLRPNHPFTGLRTKARAFRLFNVHHKVAVHSYTSKLPEWAFGQQEVNGNKNAKEPANVWLAESIVHPLLTDEVQALERQQNQDEVGKPSFLAKFAELQSIMLRHNAQLTKPHPFQSVPHTWPLLNRGISFWEKKEDGRHIYLIGNPLTWWAVFPVLFFVGLLLLADRLCIRRAAPLFPAGMSLWVWRAGGFLLLTYAMSYVPFYFQGRSLFLHHYLPAAVFSFLTAGFAGDVLYRFFYGTATAEHQQFWARLYMGACVAWTVATMGVFYYFMPWAYGLPVLDQQAAANRQWLERWELMQARA